MNGDIYHISKEDFEKVCRKVVAEHKGTRSLSGFESLCRDPISRMTYLHAI